MSVVGGPHFLRNTDTSSAHYGRYFLISSNTRTSPLDLTRIAASESANASTFFRLALQLKSFLLQRWVLCSEECDLPTNWTSGLPDDVDWIYVWDHTVGYYPIHFSQILTNQVGLVAGMVFEIWVSVQSKKIIYPTNLYRNQENSG